jgi:hypothetical protein
MAMAGKMYFIRFLMSGSPFLSVSEALAWRSTSSSLCVLSLKVVDPVDATLWCLGMMVLSGCEMRGDVSECWLRCVLFCGMVKCHLSVWNKENNADI